MLDTFMGEPIEYWMELQKKAEALKVTDFIREIAELRATVSFYESRLDDIARFRNHFTPPKQG